MKLPTIAAVAFFLLLPLVASGYIRVFEAQAPDAGTVMGRDFSRLLSDRGVKLDVRAEGDEVMFTWTSHDSGLLEDLKEMGKYMAAMKRYLESKAHEPRDTDEPSARLRIGQN